MSEATPSADRKGWVDKFLRFVEWGGNLLPHPGTLFAILALLVIVLSGVFSAMGLEVQHPSTGETIRANNLLNVGGLHDILTKMVTNFTGFAPLGTVVVAMLGIGIAESSGFIGAGLRLLVLSAPRQLITFVVVFAGVLSNAASEIGYVLLVPLGAVIFLSVGRHPIAGMAAAFAGVSGGYSANLIIGTIDPLLSGLSTEAARIIDPTYDVTPLCNYYFMLVSTLFVAVAGTWTTEKIVEPRLGKYDGDEKAESLEPLAPLEKRGLRFALVGFLIFALFIGWGVMFADFIQYNDRAITNPDGTVSTIQVLDGKSPMLAGVVALVVIGATLMAVAYGIGAKTIKNDSDVIHGMGKSISTLGTYIVLVFFAAQFVEYFKWTNLGIITAVNGANALKFLENSPVMLMIGFVFITAIMNLLMGSASAKWSIMAPIFIPMFMLLGQSPELTQVAYRIGDSTTNIISPMMSYFALVVAFFARYKKGAGIGTIVATMLPYTIVFTIVWSIMLAVWVALGLPLGPNAPLDYVPPVGIGTGG